MIKSKRVYLRALEIEDYKVSIKWRQDEEIWSSLVGRRHFVSSEYEKKWVENSIKDSSKNLKLAICLEEDNKYIGNIYLNNIDWINRSANYGILIGDKNEWGKGYAQEALNLLLKYAFIEIGLVRIEGRYFINNIASINVAKKCGFKEEGIVRKATFKEGKYQDLYLMSIILDDYLLLENN